MPINPILMHKKDKVPKKPYIVYFFVSRERSRRERLTKTDVKDFLYSPLGFVYFRTAYIEKADKLFHEGRFYRPPTHQKSSYMGDFWRNY